MWAWGKDTIMLLVVGVFHLGLDMTFGAHIRECFLRFLMGWIPEVDDEACRVNRRAVEGLGVGDAVCRIRKRSSGGRIVFPWSRGAGGGGLPKENIGKRLLAYLVIYAQ